MVTVYPRSFCPSAFFNFYISTSSHGRGLPPPHKRNCVAQSTPIREASLLPQRQPSIAGSQTSLRLQPKIPSLGNTPFVEMTGRANDGTGPDYGYILPGALLIKVITSGSHHSSMAKHRYPLPPWRITVGQWCKYGYFQKFRIRLAP